MQLHRNFTYFQEISNNYTKLPKITQKFHQAITTNSMGFHPNHKHFHIPIDNLRH